MNSAPGLRSATPADGEAIRDLTSQLGYDAEVAAVRERLARILQREDQRFVVAELDEKIVGWIHLLRGEFVDGEPFVAIAGLVVDHAHRNQGIGRVLLEHAEGWSREQGCRIVRLWSSTVRTDAHRFYERHGYVRVKTQYAFAKALDSSGDGRLTAMAPRIDAAAPGARPQQTTSQEMVIRRAAPADRETLFDIWLRSVRATHGFVSEDDMTVFMPLVREYLGSNGTDFWVLCTGDGSPIGFMGLAGSKMESLFLAPEQHGRGGGRRMVEHARVLCGELTVDVNEQNTGAVAFYKACGFVVEGRSELDESGRPYPLLHMRLSPGTPS
jgi:putative acetyltransferase